MFKLNRGFPFIAIRCAAAVHFDYAQFIYICIYIVFSSAVEEVGGTEKGRSYVERRS